MIKRIRKVEKGELLNFLYNLNINDKNLYDEVVKEQAIGIFQFTAGAAKIVVNEIQPSNFNELTAANAFARPGTLEYVPQYINNRDTKTRNYSKKISDLLEETYGVCLYQEQIMSIFNKVGLFSLEETNKVRSLMKKLGKKEKKQKDIDDWKNTVEKFAKGAAKNEINDKEVAKLTENLVSMSEYTFNKSHAVSYLQILIPLVNL
jgi:DNA polymerase-3 subunit alpha